MFPRIVLKHQFGCHQRTLARRVIVPASLTTTGPALSSRLLKQQLLLLLNTTAQSNNVLSWSLINQVGSRCRSYCSTIPKSADTVPIIYVEADGTEKEVEAEIGKNLLEVAHDNNVELEGACGGELACSTCHLVFEQSVYDTLPEKSEEEEDMLDLAFEVTETSRLGCQIIVREDFSGIKVRIPDDGF